jgi:hypothetical protein
MSSSKKLTCKGTLRQVFVCLRPRTPYRPPPLHTVYVYTVYLFTQWRGEGWDWTERQQFTKLGRKYQPILGIYISLTDTLMWWLVLRPHRPTVPFLGTHKWDFRCSAEQWLERNLYAKELYFVSISWGRPLSFLHVRLLECRRRGAGGCPNSRIALY